MQAEYVSGKVSQIGSHVFLTLDVPLPDRLIAGIFYEILTLALQANHDLLINGLPQDVSGLNEFLEGVFLETIEQTHGVVQIVGVHQFSPNKGAKSRYKRVVTDVGGDGRPTDETNRDGSQTDDPVGRQE